MTNPRPLVIARPRDSDHIKARGMAEQVMTFEPGQGEAHEPPLLLLTHCRKRTAFGMTATRLHFHKHQRAILDGDDIKFP
jgi:hypothetical protein